MVSPYSPSSSAYILASECIFKQPFGLNRKLWSFKTKTLASAGYHDVSWTTARDHVLRRIDTIISPVTNASTNMFPYYRKTYLWIIPPNGKEFQLWSYESRQGPFNPDGTVQDVSVNQLLNPDSKCYSFYIPKGSLISYGYYMATNPNAGDYSYTNLWVDEL